MHRNLLTNTRFYVLFLTISLSIGIYVYIAITNPVAQSATIERTQLYGLLSITYLYFALLAGPLCYTFRNIPFRGQYLKARRALGVSAFYFALLHSTNAFFFQLGGFEGIPFLASNYLLSISLSFTALIILSLLTLTSFDRAVSILKFKNWKLLHRLVYLAGLLLLIHVLMLGSHFSNLSSLLPTIFSLLLIVLFLLEALRIDAFLKKKIPSFQSIGPVFLLMLFLSVLYGVVLMRTPEGLELSIHAEHIKLAKQAQQQANGILTLPQNVSNQGLTGDPTKRYTVSFQKPENPEPQTQIPLRFTVFNASNGNPETLFNTLYEKKVHMIIVDETLTYYDHIHPEQTDNEFFIETTLPHDGIYHIYLDFQPFGAIEQQFAFTLSVGENINIEQPSFETTKTKQFGNYNVRLQTPEPILSQDISIGLSEFAFTLSDAITDTPLTNLHPYLAAFGHLVMIHTETFEYIHVHPNITRPPTAEDRGGPTVRFIPLGLNGPIKPGTYRLFAQFNPDGNLFTADFLITVQ